MEWLNCCCDEQTTIPDRSLRRAVATARPHVTTTLPCRAQEGGGFTRSRQRHHFICCVQAARGATCRTTSRSGRPSTTTSAVGVTLIGSSNSTRNSALRFARPKAETPTRALLALIRKASRPLNRAAQRAMTPVKRSTAGSVISWWTPRGCSSSSRFWRPTSKTVMGLSYCWQKSKNERRAYT